MNESERQNVDEIISGNVSVVIACAVFHIL